MVAGMLMHFLFSLVTHSHYLCHTAVELADFNYNSFVYNTL